MDFLNTSVTAAQEATLYNSGSGLYGVRSSLGGNVVAGYHFVSYSICQAIGLISKHNPARLRKAVRLLCQQTSRAAEATLNRTRI